MFSLGRHLVIFAALNGLFSQAVSAAEFPAELRVLEEFRWSERDLNPLGSVATRELDLNIVVMAENGWSLQQVLEDIQEVSRVYSQCSIKIGAAHVFLVREAQGRNEWTKNADSGEDSLVQLRRRTPLPNAEPVIYFVGKFKDDPEGAGFSNAQWREPYPIREELLNSVFISDYSHSEEYKKERESCPYSLVAHEMLHVLTRLGGHYNLPEKNLLNIWKTRANTILKKHCDLVQESPLLHSIP